MTELEVIARLMAHMARRDGDLVIGAGEDDAAAWREPGGTFTVATIDASVEGVHFDLARQDPEDVGWRALCLALGDLAAKGATPTYGLASLAVPPAWSLETIEAIYKGAAALAAEVGLKLVGGDTTRSPHDGSLTLALLGSTSIEPRPRSAVVNEWLIGVTGPLGGAGLAVRRPKPRLALGAELAAAGLVCGDISDGLLRELDKLSAICGVGARVRLDQVPCVPGVSSLRALGSGEEVELVCWGPDPLPAQVHQVGHLTADGSVLVLDAEGHEVAVSERGYDHFA
jgi:thiamine-monophosphate kinase